MSFASAEADRRIANLVQVGRVTAVDGGTGTARVQIGDLATASIPVCALRAGATAVWWMPSAGEQVLVLAPSGDMARAVIVASLWSGNAPSTDASVPMIDLRGGNMILKGGTIFIEADIEITGDVSIDGDMAISGSIDSAAEITASGIELTTHVHDGVLPGAAKTQGPA